MTSPSTAKGIMLYDGDCPICQLSVKYIKKLDWLGLVDFHNARDFAGIPACEVQLDPEKLLAEMHLLTPDRKHAPSGYDAFRWLAWRLPITWPFAPLLSLPGVPEIGRQIYFWVAKNRFSLVPCHDGACKVPLKRKPTAAQSV